VPISIEKEKKEAEYEWSLCLFKAFFSKVKSEFDENKQTYDFVFKYVALIPRIHESLPAHCKNSNYEAFLKQLMLSLVASFQHAVTLPDCRLGRLVQDLRATLMPQSFGKGKREERKAASQLLIASAEAIYVFQYLALLQDPAEDYLSSLLECVS